MINDCVKKTGLVFVCDLGPRLISGKYRATAMYRCSCGSIKDYRKDCVTLGQTKSCGCLRGNPPIKITHGMAKTPTYQSWASMKNRCNKQTNREYENYGGRGITYDPRWEKFENFFEDMGERPKGVSLDRINNDGNYCKDNCRWATIFEQMNNTSRNVKLQFNGKHLSVSQWGRILGINVKTISNRIKRGCTVERALSDVTY